MQRPTLATESQLTRVCVCVCVRACVPAPACTRVPAYASSEQAHARLAELQHRLDACKCP